MQCKNVDKFNITLATPTGTDVMMLGVWVGFPLVQGGWSCQLLIGRSGLTDENSTIAKNELQALTAGSNLGWTVSKALEDSRNKRIFGNLIDVEKFSAHRDDR